jgi:hypothetical protein
MSLNSNEAKRLLVDAVLPVFYRVGKNVFPGGYSYNFKEQT